MQIRYTNMICTTVVALNVAARRSFCDVHGVNAGGKWAELFGLVASTDDVIRNVLLCYGPPDFCGYRLRCKWSCCLRMGCISL